MKNLRKLRTEAGLSQQALADKFQLSQQSVQKYESGQSDPSLDTLRLFADFFDCSIDYLIDFKTDDGDIIPTHLETELLRDMRKINPVTREYLVALIT